ncbi:DNA-binding transcriptional regulator, LysR family [Arsukibacterium tuosuense]|uniref:DNA-binding transcriptional regulator, LysR family n=1 Tax=Arsukibacterium tuosuense TaxID=1323745 RepID=A0A285J8Z6_9GAMM|nr:LysR family transcriptional regulator [Arsukibacterium tuosuense]SNY56728.1 DNA-binding transcriptional regulator, LysR family [Arsukibacterium tuosuense]
MAKLPKNLTQHDIKLLRIFQTVVDCGGFTAAETELNIGRSTISIHIANLEQRLKLSLCHRGRQGFSLTREGQAVYNAIQTLEQAHQQFSQLVASLTDECSGELVILTADQLDQSRLALLSKLCAALQQQAPQLNLALDVLPLQQIELALLKDQAHLALMPGYRQIDGLQYQHVFSTPIFLCCSASHPLFSLADNNIDDDMLGSYPAIHPGIDINPEGRKQLQKLKAGARAYQFDTRLALLLSGGYIGFLPAEIARPYIESGQLRYIRPNEYQYPFNQSIVTKYSPGESAKVQLALNIVQSLLP